MKDIHSNPHMLSIIIFVIGRENSSLEQASFRSRKSMQDLPILLSDGDDISYLIRLLFFPDEIGVYELLDL